MKIGILGCRGIPNNYGGFEQFAEYLSQGLLKYGHEVYVYNSHNHPYQKRSYNGVNIIHKFDPEYKIGTTGQFIYDLNCILDSRKRKFDVILQLGYTSNSIWGNLLPKSSLILTNMDGMEWQRSKYSKGVQKFLKFAEARAVATSDHLIADSPGVQQYLKEAYQKSSSYIPYGANIFPTDEQQLNEQALQQFNLFAYQYDILVARMEPENNIEMIIKAFIDANVDRKLLVVGNFNNKFGSYIKNHHQHQKIIFAGPVYDQKQLNTLRYFSNLYYHGHSVGGTNPSLLEAMASGALIVAFSNIFNKYILGKEGYYFNNQHELTNHIRFLSKENGSPQPVINKSRIIEEFSWEKVILDYYNLISNLKK